MTNKYFNYQGAFWQIVESQSPWGEPLTYAIEFDSTYGVMMGTEDYDHENSAWEYVEAKDVRIDEWFLKSDPNDLFDAEEEDDDFLQERQKYVDMMSKVQSMSNQRSKLKEMLENLQQTPEPNGTIGRAEDILGMIRSRQEQEMQPTVVLNPKKYTDSKILESALEDIRKKDAEADIWVGTTRADDLLATLRNQETIGLSSIPDPDQALGITIDSEILSILKNITKFR